MALEKSKYMFVEVLFCLKAVILTLAPTRSWQGTCRICRKRTSPRRCPCKWLEVACTEEHY